MKPRIASALPPDTRAWDGRRFCYLSFIMLAVPAAEFVLVAILDAAPWPRFLAALWITSAVIGLLFGVRAFHLTRRTGNGLSLLAVCAHTGALILFGILWLLGETAK